MVEEKGVSCPIIQYLLSIDYVTSPVLGAQDTNGTQWTGSCPWGASRAGMRRQCKYQVPRGRSWHLSNIPKDGAPQADKIMDRAPRHHEESSQTPGCGWLEPLAGGRDPQLPPLVLPASQASLIFPWEPGVPVPRGRSCHQRASH